MFMTLSFTLPHHFHNFEESFVTSCTHSSIQIHWSSTPIFLKRYVDNVCTALKVYSIEEFHHHIHSVEETIQFAMEEESDGKLAFLDTELSIMPMEV